jgi:NAD+ kinase
MIPGMSSSSLKIGLVLKRHDPRVQWILAEIVPWLQGQGVGILLDQGSAQQYPASCSVVPSEELASHVDIVTVFGGDGTLLHAAHLVGGSGVPILGINLGSLGFLAEVKLEEMRQAFESLIRGDYRIEERMLLDIEIFRSDNTPVARYLALNDAVINKAAFARIIELEIIVNGQVVTVTRADGLIVSTPTGSTAYSLSAGGPILYPTLEAFIVTPICPHTLTNRPVVVPDHVTVEIRLGRGTDVMLTVDGQIGMPLQPADRIKIQKAAPVIRLVLSTGSSFFKLLREKLKWS